MDNQCIEDYLTNHIGLEFLAKKYGVGKIKIKEFLSANGVDIKKRGGQIKYDNVAEKITYDNKQISCKICSKIFNDVENKSGSVLNHIKTHYSDLVIPSAHIRRRHLAATGLHWHLDFYNIISKDTPALLFCPECDWTTTDITNQSGSLTKHIQNSHDNTSDFLLRNPDYSHCFNNFYFNNEKEQYFTVSENYITCKLCDEKFKIISNSHLKKHNITQERYMELFGKESLISKTTKIEYSERLIELPASYKSKAQIEIENFINELGFETISGSKKILKIGEIDILVPEKNIGIEYNGLYWHSEKSGRYKDYHVNKTIKCSENDIQLIHIFSDTWESKKEIVKNRIKHALGVSDSKVYARKCNIVNITNNEKSVFLNETHLQGNDKSQIFYGLKYENKLVAVITFSKLRRSLGYKGNKDGVWELQRYSAINVVGGFNKLLKHFIQSYNPKQIISYADRDWSADNKFCFYGKVGFDFVGYTKPNYFYTKNYIKRENRFNYRKDILISKGFDKNKTESEIMMENGYDRIWDTGNLKYVLNLSE